MVSKLKKIGKWQLLAREDKSQSFEEYFWQDIDLDNRMILDAGTGFGLTTSEIAKREWSGREWKQYTDPSLKER